MPSIFLQPQLLAGCRPRERESSVPETRRNAKKGIPRAPVHISPQRCGEASTPQNPCRRARLRPEARRLKPHRLESEERRPAAPSSLPGRGRGRGLTGAPEGPPEKKKKKNPRRWGRGRPRRACSDPHKRDCVSPVPVPREPHRRRPTDAVLPKRPLPALRRIRQDVRNPGSAACRSNREDQTFT